VTLIARKPQNRGPAAAAANRAALLAAAREVFAESGLRAPLNAVARRAGVGQGSLYRHFPDRVALAMAVFEENVDELEALAAEPGVTLGDLIGLLNRHIIGSSAFVDLVRAEGHGEGIDALAVRVEQALAAGLATDATGAPAGLTGDDLRLAVAMVAGAVTGIPAASRAQVADRAWELLGFRL